MNTGVVELRVFFLRYFESERFKGRQNLEIKPERTGLRQRLEEWHRKQPGSPHLGKCTEGRGETEMELGREVAAGNKQHFLILHDPVLLITQV